jgi:tetratricopeptide (TPR) repeat protein
MANRPFPPTAGSVTDDGASGTAAAARGPETLGTFGASDAGRIVARSTPPAEVYDSTLTRAIAAALGHSLALAGARAGAEREIVDLLRRAAPAAAAHKTLHGFHPGMPAARRGLQLWARCEALLEASRALRASDPAGMVVLAALAHACAETLDPRQCGGAAHVADLQARVWAELGDAHRVAGDLQRAGLALDRALETAGRGTGDPLLLALVMDLTASLYEDHGRLTDAACLLDWVYTVYGATGEHHLAGCALIGRGMLASRQGHDDDALTLLTAGLERIDGAADPDRVLAAAHALLDLAGRRAVAAAGEKEGADPPRRLAQFLSDRCDAALDELRQRWVETSIAADFAEIARMEADFLAVREHCATDCLPNAAAAAALDLAEAWLRQGRTAQAQHVVEQMLATFRALRVRRDAIGILLKLRRALASGRATIELLRASASQLRHLDDSLPLRHDIAPAPPRKR